MLSTSALMPALYSLSQVLDRLWAEHTLSRVV